MAMDMNAAVRITASVQGQQQLDKLTDGLSKMGKTGEISAGQTANAMRMLPAQFTDVVTQLAGGQNPLLILIQQGGQVKDMFGGIVPALRAVATLFTPIATAVGILAVGFGGLAYAMFQGASEFSALNKAMLLTGGATGLAAGSFDAMAKRIQSTVGDTIGGTRELLGLVNSSAAFSIASIEQAATAMGRVQKLSGQSAEEVAKDFASMTRGVASWAAEHNRQYNYLSVAQFKYIMDLERNNRADEASRVNIEYLNNALKDRTVQLGYLDTALKTTAGWWSAFWLAANNVGKPDTEEDKLATLRQRLENINGLREGMARRGQTVPVEGPNIALLKQQIAELETSIGSATSAREKISKEAEATRTQIADMLGGKGFAEAAASQGLANQLLKNASQERINIMEQELAQLAVKHKSGLMDDTDYENERLGIRTRILGENAALLSREMALEAKRGTKDTADAIAQKTKLAAMKGQLDVLQSQKKVSEIEATATPNDGLAERIKALNVQLAQLGFQNGHIKEFGDSISSANLAGAQFEVTLGKWKNASPELKEQILAVAKAVDVQANSLKMSQTGLDFEKQTRMIRANTSALGEGAVQQKITAALQDLENRGIKQGSELYEVLAASRRSAIKEAAAAQGSFGLGIKNGMNEYLATIEDRAGAAKTALVNAFKGAEDALVNFVMTGKFNFKDFASSIIKDLIRIMIQQSIMKPLMGGLGSLFSGLGGGADTAMAGTASIGTFAANGGAFSNGVKMFAQGGVVNGPTTFPMANGTGLMGEAGPEAIMPLKRTASGALGIMSQGGGGQVNNVTVNVSVSGGDETTANSQTGAALGGIISKAVQSELVRQKRPGGLLFAGA